MLDGLEGYQTFLILRKALAGQERGPLSALLRPFARGPGWNQDALDLSVQRPAFHTEVHRHLGLGGH